MFVVRFLFLGAKVLKIRETAVRFADFFSLGHHDLELRSSLHSR